MKQSVLIAIVDDDPNVLESLGDMLRSSNLLVRTFASATQFLQSNLISWIDLLITDVRMPGMTGIELRDHVRSIRPSLPLFFITGESGTDENTEQLTQNSCRVFRKPFNSSEVYKAIIDEIVENQ